MAFYTSITSLRQTWPDLVALTATVRASFADAALNTMDGQHYALKKSTAWAPADIATVQAAIDTAPAITPQRQAQNEIDAWPLSLKALVLALIDQLNVIRAALPTPLPPITPGQALAAIRTKAGTL